MIHSVRHSPQRWLTVKTIAVSLSVHIFILCFVILSFTSMAAVPQPALVFLGSILPKKDFVTFSLGQTHPSQAPKRIAVSERHIRLNSTDQIGPAKPNYSAAVTPASQTVLKSNFEVEQQDKEKAVDATIDFEPYVPLRLKVDDKN